MSDNETIYEVEEILRRKFEKDQVKLNKYIFLLVLTLLFLRQTFYLIKWLGYTDSENSWEPAENLVGCDEILPNFIDGKARTILSKLIFLQR